jgi:hypothetical protein
MRSWTAAMMVAARHTNPKTEGGFGLASNPPAN